MMQVDAIESTDQLAELKQQYMQQTTAPLDGMWLCGFVPMASHYAFSLQNDLVGFCCANGEGYLLQFFVAPPHQNEASDLFGAVVQGRVAVVGTINGAFASTAEPLYLSLCFDHLSRCNVNAVMYQLDDASVVASSDQDDLGLVAVAPAQLADAVEFAIASTGAPAEWLEGYFGNLISRGELFGVWENGRLVATGETRGYDEYQTRYADVGMIVAESERGRGLATRVLKRLVALNEAKGLESICSTEKTNIGAQKAICRAGFSARNRIVQFDL